MYQIIQVGFRFASSTASKCFVELAHMMNKTGANVFSLSLGLPLASLKVTYLSENRSFRHDLAVSLKREGEKEAFRILEDSGPATAPSMTGFKLPLDFLVLILKNWQKLFLRLILSLKVLLGLPA